MTYKLTPERKKALNEFESPDGVWGNWFGWGPKEEERRNSVCGFQWDIHKIMQERLLGPGR